MKRHHKGFSLIEVLIAMAVVALGLLAVATFQTNLMKESSSSKSKSEALAIAQAYLDQMRNYTDGVPVLHVTTPLTTEAEFNTAFANTSGTSAVNFTDSSNTAITVSGINAIFTPKYRIATGSTSGKTVAVTVEWSEKDGTTQSVTLNTQLGWQSPRAVGDLASNDPSSLIPAPTGRAHLGEGTLTNDIVTANTATNYGNNARSVNDGSGDLKLVIYDSSLTNQQVVLTLENACVSGTCTDFVKIKGRVYIDKAAQAVSPSDLYIKASDAAYCHRYYTNSSGVVTNVTSTTTSSDTPDSRGTDSARYDDVGDYEYYDYTCYLGGGWHGNLGLVKAGGLGVHDLACLGDPTSVYPYEQPVITARRAYRGMVHKVSGGSPVRNPSNNMIVYYSAGVHDAVTINGQDFLFTSLSGNPTDSDCFSASSPMKRTDATVSGVAGALFDDMPDEFYCLNEDGSSYVDHSLFDFTDASTGYTLSSTCPYDPTDPPTAYNTVSGAVTISSSTSGLESLIGANLNINTSDAAGNCTDPISFTYNSAAQTYTGSYTCNVYHKGTGWSGYIMLTYDKVNITDPSLTCSVTQINLLNIMTNATGKDFSTCATGTPRTISGTITVASTINGLESDLATIVNLDDSVANINNCVKGAFVDNGSNYTSTYTCTEVDMGTGWTGNISISSTMVNNRGVSCTTSQLAFTNLTADSSGQNFSTCDQTAIHKISGTAISSANGKSLTTVTVTPSGGTATACTITNTGGDNRSYECSIAFPGSASTWSGTLDFSATNGAAVCSGSTSATPKTYNSISPADQTYNVTIKNGNC